MKLLIPALGRINTRNRDGGEIRLSQAALVWQKMGHEIHLVLPPREEKILKDSGVKANYHVLPEKTKYEDENLFWILLIYLSRIIKAFRFIPPKGIDLIYVPADFLVELIPGIIWKLKSKKSKLIVCVLLVAPHPFRGYRFGFQSGLTRPTIRGFLYFLSQRFGIWLLKKFADQVLVLNGIDKIALEKLGLKGRTEVISMGVNLKEYRQVREGLKKYDGCFIGRLHPQKGLFDLLEVWQVITGEIPRARLAIIGGGSWQFQEKLQDRINRMHLEKNVEFLGFKEGEEKIKLLKQSRVFVLPSFYESWGMVAVEAMAGGLPVVAYDLPIFPELFSQGMVLAPLGETKEFAQAVLKLLKDDHFYLKVKKSAVSQAKLYDWQSVVEREYKIWKRVFRTNKLK